MKAIVNGRILLPTSEVSDKVLIFNDKIIGLDDRAPAACEVIDAEGRYVAPGFIDVHTHGYGGDDVSDGSADGIRRMAKGILANGVTSFLPTTMTIGWKELQRAFKAIRLAMDDSVRRDFDGAQVLGCHAEGPFINSSKKGAQAESAILPPDADMVRPYADIIRVMTLAPEVPGALECIQSLRDMGIRASIGHTASGGDICIQALSAGANRFTHLFNAMTPFGHREIGAAGAALCSDAFAEIICDGIHINPRVFPMLRRTKGEKLVLITDATRAAGMADGEYTLGGQKIILQNGACRLEDGTLAGSVLKMNEAVSNYRNFTGAKMFEAVRAASLAPALSVGLTTKGALVPGMDADIQLLDENVTSCAVWIGGARKF